MLGYLMNSITGTQSAHRLASTPPRSSPQLALSLA
jgi:hypothetical protein